MRKLLNWKTAAYFGLRALQRTGTAALILAVERSFLLTDGLTKPKKGRFLMDLKSTIFVKIQPALTMTTSKPSATKRTSDAEMLERIFSHIAKRKRIASEATNSRQKIPNFTKGEMFFLVNVKPATNKGERSKCQQYTM